MPPIVVYVRSWCPWCRRAKQLLESKGADYEEIDIESGPGLEREMVQKAGGRTTVPQVFIGERHIGGYDDLDALDRAGGLDPLLAPE